MWVLSIPMCIITLSYICYYIYCRWGWSPLPSEKKWSIDADDTDNDTKNESDRRDDIIVGTDVQFLSKVSLK